MAGFFLFLCLPLLIQNTESRSYKNVHEFLTSDEKREVFGWTLVDDQDVPDYDVIHPVQVDSNGNFLSRDPANGNTRRRRDLDKTTNEGLFWKFEAFGRHFHLNVTRNDKLFSPDFVVEIRGNGTNRYEFDTEHCHHVGQLASPGEHESKVALSDCDGLRGMIYTTGHRLVLSPLPLRLGLHKKNTRAHVIYRRSARDWDTPRSAALWEGRTEKWCGVQDDSRLRTPLRMHHSKSRRSVADKVYTIEVMVVTDKGMASSYGVKQLKTYIPTLINVVHGLLADSSLGVKIKYILHKLLILQNDQPGLTINAHAPNTLTSFCNWANGQNVQDDNDAAHFDHAALITRTGLCRNTISAKDKKCETMLGLAGLAGMCSTSDSCTLSTDSGLGSAFTIAHETGHNLGAEHDGFQNNCSDGVNVMAAKASGKKTAFVWSSCSRKYITDFVTGDQAGCLADKAVHSIQMPTKLPGQIYDVNEQCARMMGNGSQECTIPDLKAKMCTALWCTKPDGSCSTNDEPAATGTPCATGKWCKRGDCVAVDQGQEQGQTQGQGQGQGQGQSQGKGQSQGQGQGSSQGQGSGQGQGQGIGPTQVPKPVQSKKVFTFAGFPDYNGDDYQKIAVIPAGARQIRIEEVSASNNVLALRTSGGADLLNMDMYSIGHDAQNVTVTGAGTQFKYSRGSNLKELVTAPGPLAESVELKYLVEEWDSEYKVKYQYTRPTQRKRGFGWQPDRTPDDQKPRWKIGKWTECSKTCDGGRPVYKVREVMCVTGFHDIEVEVGNDVCAEPRPETRATCGDQACPADWGVVRAGKCSTTCGQGVRELEVTCQRTNSNGQTERLQDQECAQRMKPPTHAPCNVDKTCAGDEDTLPVDGRVFD